MNSWKRLKLWQKVLIGIGVFLVLVIAIGSTAKQPASRNTASTRVKPQARSSSTVKPKPKASLVTLDASYANVRDLLAALAQGGARCSHVSISNGSAVNGAVNPFAECSGVSSGDTAIVMFTIRADAVAYANSMLNAGESIGPTAEVVGANWAVNTTPSYARKVVKAIGGQLMTESSSPSVTPSTSSPSSAPPPSAPQVNTVMFIVYGDGSPVDITYGPAGSDNTGTEPMDVTEDIPSSPPAYYAISAQLQGSGSVSVIIKVDGQQISSGVANGGYNIASAEISQDPVTGQWQDDNS